MAKLDTLLNVFGHYKYLITIVVGLLFVGVLSETSLINLMKLDMVRNDLQAEVERYRKQSHDAEKELKALKNNPRAVEKVARERYFMKRHNEDVFVLSSDIPTVNDTENNGTTK